MSTDLVFLSGTEPVTSTLVIAENTQNEHASVIKLVRASLADLETFGPCRFEIDVASRPQGGGAGREIALLNERQATLLITYMRNNEIVRAFKIRLVGEFYAMAQKLRPVLPPMTPSQVGKQCILDMLDVAVLFGAPKSYALQVAASEAVRQTGMPWDRLLTQAEAMQNIPHEDVLLEPTELGKLFDLGPVAMNRQLVAFGLQVKEGGEWRPTEEGAALCQRHAWVSGSKSGYNLKWRAKDIEAMMAERTTGANQ